MIMHQLLPSVIWNPRFSFLTIMARIHRESASESESKLPINSRSSNKVRNAVAHAAQQEYLAKHIHSNGPHDKPKVDPLDFDAFDVDTLDKYSQVYNLGLPLTQTLNDDILSSEIGKKTYTYKRNQGYKINKPEKVHAVKNHFLALPSRENEIIANFLYKLRNEDKDFKLEFR